ncbi:baseplate wedge subunit [Synechococcus phage S-SM2]|uniref:Baseplate wedge n=1 Tax=Synechococcus phage S-SM2 TaxID=444860 RepID=E3SIZ2_9CAUD|nr:baseplate wedge subunit [Synechococcus phage S-SM2]ADO97440.1 baseplate wedge [Synechococcus phage S-SM2]
MAAIITDQIRILNAKNFVSGITSSANSYYSFIGLPNPSDYQDDWDSNPPAPKDNFSQENDYWDTMVALKKINSGDVRQVIPKRTWTSGTTYDMYRHDYSVTNTAAVSGATNLYSAFYYVMNSDFRVYACLQNGTDPNNPNGKPSLDEPTFTDLEPRSAGSSGDGYLWKYLYTIKPNEVVKFESTDFMPVPADWATSTDNAAVRDNAVDGSIKVVTVTNSGVGLGTANQTYTRVPIQGDGTGAECTLTVGADSKVSGVTVSNQGSGYSYGSLNLEAGGVPTGTTIPTFDVIMAPQGGHGADIYRELGAYNVLLYSRIENDNENPDFVTGNQIARVGIVENPQVSVGNVLTSDKASALNALKLTGTGYSSASFTADSYFTQTVATGSTAVGRVVNYDATTGVLKYWQDRSLAGFTTAGIGITNPTYGFDLKEFTASPDAGGSVTIVPSSGSNLAIDTSFTGITTVINNRTYYLGQSFTSGVAGPEVKKHAGNIIYVDNRPSITRSSNQKEDIKIILQF